LTIREKTAPATPPGRCCPTSKQEILDIRDAAVFTNDDPVRRTAQLDRGVAGVFAAGGAGLVVVE
jgi:hypothetical protein